jgi:hypothetical protein
VAVAEDIQKATDLMEILEAWEQDTVIKTEVDLVAVEDLTTDNLTVQAVAEAVQEMQALTQDVQQLKMESDHLLVKEDLVGALELQVADAVHHIAGLHGLELVEEAEMVCMELQAVAEAEDQQVEEDLVAVAQEAHRQLIIMEAKAWTEQVQAAEEITIMVELDKREVLA